MHDYGGLQISTILPITEMPRNNFCNKSKQGPASTAPAHAEKSTNIHYCWGNGTFVGFRRRYGAPVRLQEADKLQIPGEMSSTDSQCLI